MDCVVEVNVQQKNIIYAAIQVCVVSNLPAGIMKQIDSVFWYIAIAATLDSDITSNPLMKIMISDAHLYISIVK